MTGRHLLLKCLAPAAAILSLSAGAAEPGDWPAVLEEARGQTVYFNAWGGDLAINQYIDWVADRVGDEFDIDLRHVKVTDIAESVTRIMAERSGGRDRDGTVDLLWINGENFASLKKAGLLYGPWAGELPNASLIDWQGNPTTYIDVTLDTEGYELPWGTAALTFFFDRARVSHPPETPSDLLAWIERHPGRFSYPQPPAFIGSAFLKQMLLLLAGEPSRLQRPADDDFAAVTAPLWAWLDRTHAAMWRGGRLFPQSGPAQRELMSIGELDWMLSYNPSEANRAIRQHELTENVGALQLSGGALGNSHFLAIPWNSSATAGARVVANFLISPEAQARKSDERYWGDPTVLDVDELDEAGRQRFKALLPGPATPPAGVRVLPEPHPSWTTRLESAWRQRYLR